MTIDSRTRSERSPAKERAAMNDDPISDFLKAVEAAAIELTDVYSDDAVLDATVPNWRFCLVGPEAIKTEYSKWFCDPATFVSLERMPVPDGEVVIYEHEFMHDGVRHRAHHAHHLVVREGKIAADTVWCGGKWPEPLLKDMAETNRA
jgi:hypothetical protein